MSKFISSQDHTEDDDAQTVEITSTLGAQLSQLAFFCTMGQNGEKQRINSHPIIHFPMSEGVSEASERMSEQYE